MTFLVLGGGAQGSAAAFDLLQDHAVERVVLADLNVEAVQPFLAPHVGGRLELRQVDASSERDVAALMEGATGVLCALPYFFNFSMARAAVATGAHYTDLGGKTEIVGRQRTLHDEARARGVSVVPDTGLAPGMVNVLAEEGIRSMDAAESVRIWVGGLPQHPRPPLDYQIVYSLEGVLDYYVTPATVLRDGRKTQVEALSGLETVEFPDPPGTLEAFYTGGGISTMPDRYEGRVRAMEYKTLRYPGHARIMRAVRELGLLDAREVEVDGARVAPRKLFIRQATPALSNPRGEDLVAARVQVDGAKDGIPRTVVYEVHDAQDPATGITAMARTTGFSLSITALMQARGRVAAAGVGTPDEVVPPDLYVAELGRRGIQVHRTQGTT